MRFLKIWAKNRLIYSNIAGYLSGSSLAIMSAKICIIYPNASLPIAIKQFFIFYKLWLFLYFNFLEKYFILFRGWPQPILLNELENEFKKAKEIVEPWKWINKEDNSEFENDSETDSNDELLEEEKEGNDGTQMSIITSGFPEQNTTFNVNKFTFKRIIKEIKRGKFKLKFK
uniref:polynucleotide adenylyltransferase n=1 Tax=Meloidogyne incognita TaxID=6306 RepID=A0A914NAC7_MELIC